MAFQFPDNFLWGTSTAAAQIETASDHNWRGVKAKDGFTFLRTSDHEQHRAEDAELIAELGSIYRCGVDWARLQREAFAPFDKGVVLEYRTFFEDLRQRGVSILFVLHHFAHPRWFEEAGAFTTEDNTSAFIDYVQQCITHFGEYVVNWNTFNEPNVYALNGYVLGNFPPFKKNILTANRVLRTMGDAHDVAIELLHERCPGVPVGISFNTAIFKGETLLGKLPAAFTDWWFMRYAAKHFTNVDYWGLSYYAYVPFRPLPITEIDNPGKLAQLGKPHDQMWGYYPQGLGEVLRRFYKKYKKPLLITESGICTDDPERRIEAIRDYVGECRDALQAGIPLMGYIHWSTFDNFEWQLGPTYRFGLVALDPVTKARSRTSAGRYYSELVSTGRLAG